VLIGVSSKNMKAIGHSTGDWKRLLTGKARARLRGPWGRAHRIRHSLEIDDCQPRFHTGSEILPHHRREGPRLSWMIAIEHA
jgi:hypothetical protein